jgi:hypothetical protein
MSISACQLSEAIMTANKTNIYMLGADLCKAALYFIALGLIVQGLDNFFYTLPYDRLFLFGTAFIVTFALCQAFRAMARQAERSSRRRAVGYSPAMVGKTR